MDTSPKNVFDTVLFFRATSAMYYYIDVVALTLVPFGTDVVPYYYSSSDSIV